MPGVGDIQGRADVHGIPTLGLRALASRRERAAGRWSRHVGKTFSIDSSGYAASTQVGELYPGGPKCRCATSPQQLPCWCGLDDAAGIHDRKTPISLSCKDSGVVADESAPILLSVRGGSGMSETKANVPRLTTKSATIGSITLSTTVLVIE